MFDHLRYRGAKVVSHSETGDFAIELLDLNSPTSVEYRAFFERILEDARTKLQECANLVKDIEKAINGSSGARVVKLNDGLRRAQAKRTAAELHLTFITGPYEPLPQ